MAVWYSRVWLYHDLGNFSQLTYIQALPALLPVNSEKKWKWGEKVKVAQLHLILCDPMAIPSVHGVLQARKLEWVAFSSPRESSQPRDQTQVSHIAGGSFTIWVTREAQDCWRG